MGVLIDMWNVLCVLLIAAALAVLWFGDLG
jgi:hypothetical protein